MPSIKKLCILLYILAVAVVVIPTMIVGITGNAYGETFSNTMMSFCAGFLILATLLGANPKDKTKFYKKIGFVIGLLVVIIQRWL